MKEDNTKNNFFHATKWSFITEIMSKLVTPISNMVLARIISPEAFGVVTTITMIMSFADMFTDAGFQKFLVQHEFKNNKEKYESANVAFWTNFIISILLWGLIIIFKDSLANLVGNPGLGDVIAISCVQLLLTSFSSIQLALYRRDFDFKTLFSIRILTICIPFIVTIPLAFLGLEYWSIIIASIITQLSNAIVLTVKSKWKPRIYYNKIILKKMVSFSIWSLIEAISIWFTTWIDMFIIGSFLDEYHLGIYKTSTSMVNSIMSLITAAIVPVLFSSLSRLQTNNNKFNEVYFNTQRMVAIFVFPLGVGIYLYSDLATKIFLGNNWSEASKVIGIWALTSAIMIVLSYFSSEVYRAKGRPKLSFLSQILHLIVLVPTCLISSKYGFEILVYARAWVRIEAVIVNFIIMQLVLKISILKTIINITPILVSTLIMGGFGYLVNSIDDSIIWSFMSILLCMIVYFLTLYTFPSMREEMKKALNLIRKKGMNKAVHKIEAV